MKQIALCVLLSVCSLYGYSQKRKIEIVHTDLMVGDRQVRKLYGNVEFKHQDMRMFCDSAYFYVKDNRFEAYTNVKIINNTVTITSDTLYYSSQTNIARFRGKIKMVNNDVTLTTNFLDYNAKDNIGMYYNSGKIVDRENTLTSKIARYTVNDNMLFFKNSVVLKNKDYTIHTDTLKYQTVSKTAYFHGPTKIISKENLLYTENGWYNTQTNIAQFFKNSYINSKAQFVYGDSLYYNRNTDIGKAYKNVIIKDTTEQLFLYGEKGFYNGKEDFVYVTNKIVLIKAFAKDSLYLHADSIFSKRLAINPQKPDSATYQIVKAYHKTRFYKSDVQGVCDSLVYHSLDSVIHLFVKPVIWSDENQITGNSIQLRLVNNVIEHIYIDANAFLIAQDNAIQFNQMKGKSLQGYIKNNQLYKVDIMNNGETVYFLRDSDELVGINKAICDSITAYIDKGKVQRIVFKSKPSGTLFPPNEISGNEVQLENFKWLEHIRPQHAKDIFIWRE
ncbi:MAG TPA: OstA-like protein [Bacteroidales bacterium]|nr:OstA-like protein [Bacteroidales bacterium]